MIGFLSWSANHHGCQINKISAVAALFGWRDFSTIPDCNIDKRPKTFI
jgi:hypothetical protein